MTNSGGAIAALRYDPGMVVLTKTSLDETLTAHREAVRRSAFPPPRRGANRSFLHGFFLPFSLILTTLRHPTLGRSYAKVTVVRMLAVAVLAALALQVANPKRERAATAPSQHHRGFYIDLGKTKSAASSDLSDLDNTERAIVSAAEAAAKKAEESASSTAPAASTPPPIVARLTRSWAWIVWFVGVLSAVEGLVVFFSRRYDDWLGYWTAPLARVRPEDPFPKPPKVAVDLKWLIKKMKRRLRGYIVFGAGVPLIACFNLVPGRAGSILFSLGLTMWGWYWLAVFTTAKSAHAWADDSVAPSPLLIREIRDRSVGRWWLAPFRLYGRLWARLTKSVNSPAQMFEQNPAPFLGMALARCILSFPGLYLLARPVIPVAASRLIAESDPRERFSI